MVLSGRSFFSFAGALEADLNEFKKTQTCQDLISKSVGNMMDIQ